MTPTCPDCGGFFIAVLARAWCLERYDLGGCGGYFVRRGGAWRLP